MSASRQKKLRQEQSPAELEKKKQVVTEEEKSAKRLKLWTIVFYVAIACMVIGVICSSVVNAGVLERTLTAATVSGHKLTAADLNYYFLNAVNNETYLPYLVDNTTPLDEQEYSENQTWADMMMETALQTARNVYAVYDEAVAQGYTLSETDQAALEQEITTLNTYATMYGYPDADSLLSSNYGKGCNVKNYRNYLTVQAIATGYRNSIIGGLTFTQEEIEAEAAANAGDYTSYSYRVATLSTSRYYSNTDVSEHTEEETAEALKAAETAAAMVAAAGQKGEDAFVSAVKLETKTEDDNTLRSGYLKSKVTGAYAEWVTDSARKAGDVTTITMDNDAGYYVVLFLGTDDNTETHLVDVRHILVQTSDTVSAEDALVRIQEIKAEYDADPTEENFAALAAKFTEDGGSSTTGGLYEHVYPGQMVEAFNDWCFDPARKTGDVDVVETSYGYHLMYFVGADEQNYRDYMAENALMEAAYTEWYTGLTEAQTYTTGSAIKMVKTGIVVPAPNTSAY